MDPLIRSTILFSSAVDEVTGVHLRLYFLQAPIFKNDHPAPGEDRLEELADVRFMANTSPELVEYYQVRAKRGDFFTSKAVSS